MTELSWCEIDSEALQGNIEALRALVGQDRLLAPAVKANAYGHGLEVCARAFVDGGADWLAVNALFEARRIRELGLDVPVYVMGYVAPDDVDEALSLGCHLVVYDSDVVEAAARAAGPSPAQLHIKLETGNNRQGLAEDDALALARVIHADSRVQLAGLATHFADVEDTTDHTFAAAQMVRFHAFVSALAAEGIVVRYRHVSNSAATILWPEAHLELVRAGIACYGMWPSTETYVSALEAGRGRIQLRPAMSWKTRVVQVRDVPAGEYVGYGRTFRTTHPTRLAVLPVGYYDGYDRGLSNLAHVLVRGCRAPVRGRVCMNLTMVDVTHVPGVHVGDEVVLLGCDGDERISAEQMAGWAGTINYEVTTRINDRVPRRATGIPTPVDHR
jgi:alanine racemase